LDEGGAPSHGRAINWPLESPQTKIVGTAVDLMVARERLWRTRVAGVFWADTEGEPAEKDRDAKRNVDRNFHGEYCFTSTEPLFSCAQGRKLQAWPAQEQQVWPLWHPSGLSKTIFYISGFHGLALFRSKGVNGLFLNAFKRRRCGGRKSAPGGKVWL